MAEKKKKRILHKFRLSEISGVDRMAQEGAKLVLLKREDPDDMAKTMFDEALDQLELNENVDNALRDMWRINDALRMSIRSIVTDPVKYPNPMESVKESLDEFATAVSSMVSDAVGVVEEVIDTDEDEVEKYSPDQERDEAGRFSDGGGGGRVSGGRTSRFGYGDKVKFKSSDGKVYTGKASGFGEESGAGGRFHVDFPSKNAPPEAEFDEDYGKPVLWDVEGASLKIGKDLGKNDLGSSPVVIAVHRYLKYSPDQERDDDGRFSGDGNCMEDLKKQTTKTEGGKQFPASDYAYVPDSESPSTWKLRLTSTPGGDPDPRIVGAAVAALGPGFRGQKVEIPSQDRATVKKKVLSAWKKINPDTEDKDVPAVLKSEEGVREMEKMETENKEIIILKGLLAKAERIATLCDAEKEYFAKLDKEDQDRFMGLSTEDRTKELAKLIVDDPVIYKTLDGIEFHKSDDPRLITMAKRADENEKVAKREREERELIELKKQVEDDLDYLPGEEETKIAMLKAIKTINDEDTRKAALEVLKAHNSLHQSAFRQTGVDGASSTSAEDKLVALAKSRAEQDDTSFEKAYSEVLKTEEGKKLYEQTL